MFTSKSTLTLVQSETDQASELNENIGLKGEDLWRKANKRLDNIKNAVPNQIAVYVMELQEFTSNKDSFNEAKGLLSRSQTRVYLGFNQKKTGLRQKEEFYFNNIGFLRKTLSGPSMGEKYTTNYQEIANAFFNLISSKNGKNKKKINPWQETEDFGPVPVRALIKYIRTTMNEIADSN